MFLIKSSTRLVLIYLFFLVGWGDGFWCLLWWPWQTARRDSQVPETSFKREKPTHRTRYRVRCRPSIRWISQARTLHAPGVCLISTLSAYRSRLSIKLSSKLLGRLLTSPQELQNTLKLLSTLRLYQSSLTFSPLPFSMFVSKQFGLWETLPATVLNAETTSFNKVLLGHCLPCWVRITSWACSGMQLGPWAISAEANLLSQTGSW